jgi:hypothetical protein
VALILSLILTGTALKQAASPLGTTLL